MALTQYKFIIITQPNPGGALGSAESFEGPVSLLHAGPSSLLRGLSIGSGWGIRVPGLEVVLTYSTGQSSVPGPHLTPRGARKGTLVCAQEEAANSSFCHLGIPLLPLTNGSERSLGHLPGGGLGCGPGRMASFSLRWGGCYV